MMATAADLLRWQWNHDSLMMCSGRSSAYPLQNRDLADFEGLYTPNAVSDDPADPPLAVPGADPGSVVFTFDARRVRVEEDLRIYRWQEDAAAPGNSRWVHVETFVPSSARVTWMARNQPGGDQVYRIFSTTPVVAAGQCYIDDRDCTDRRVRLNVDRIGFPTNDVTVAVVGPPPAVLYRLSVAIEGEVVDTEGLGSVTRSLSGPTYEDGTTVVLTAVPLTKTYGATLDGGLATDPIMTLVVSEFVRWDGHPDAVACNTNANTMLCSLDMDEHMNVIARFRTVMHLLTVELPSSATSNPGPDMHEYVAGTTVTVIPNWDENARDYDDGWDGCYDTGNIAGTSRWRCSVYMNRDKTVRLTLDPVVSIEANSTTGSTEGDGVLFTVRRTGATTGSLEVNLSTDETGSMISGAGPVSIEIPIGAASAEATVPTHNDPTYEPDSTITIVLEAGSAYDLHRESSRRQASVTVADNDKPSISIAATSTGSLTEGDDVIFELTRHGDSAPALTVAVLVTEFGGEMYSGVERREVALASGSDTAELSLSTVDDTQEEPDSDLTVTVVATTSDDYTPQPGMNSAAVFRRRRRQHSGGANRAVRSSRVGYCHIPSSNHRG